LLVHHRCLNYALANCIRDMNAQAERGNEVEEGRPDHGLRRSQDSSRDDCGDRVSRVMEAVDEVEPEGESDNEDDEEQFPVHQQLAFAAATKKGSDASLLELPLGCLGILEDDGFEDVSNLLRAIGGALELIVDVAPFDDIY